MRLRANKVGGYSNYAMSPEFLTQSNIVATTEP